jgi:hypothetical protein
MYKLCKKLKAFKAVLKSKNTSCYGDIRTKVLKARECLEIAQRAVLNSHGSAESLIKERECLHEYTSISRVEEAFLKQKARNQWLQLGDQNSGFFHRVIKARQARNTINYICDDNGNRIKDIAGIKNIVENFYKRLLGSSTMVFSGDGAARIKHLISPIVSAEQAVLLENSVSAEEIKSIFFSMKANKSPGPDGYTAEFFKSSWEVVGEDVVVAIQSFFDSGMLLKEVNATILSLVPKRPNVSVMGDFRPIACCNVIYKCITKILSNRMLPLLDSMISRNQSAFIPGRNIAENVLLAQEMVRNYHRKDGQPRCTMKIDLMKAYDSVNWNFLIHCLSCFGFPPKFVNWIKECITSPRFSISLNETLVGYFKGAKGFRQGDPLSPYLFVIAMEVFSRIMCEFTGSNSGFKFHPRCSKLQLTHLCFADDMLLFSEASLSSIKAVKAVLLEFEQLSGLQANPSKSSFFCAGISSRMKAVLLDELQMEEGHFPVRYLGVPLIASKLSAVEC